MAPEGGGGSRNNNSRRKKVEITPQGALKKGPWTAEEDAILNEYVRKHGEGNWNAVQRNSGLMRCGKSCRLRWVNHLRPNLKKGTFSAEEEAIIVDLHSKLGNKWARMAIQLPGRTDNEIKNYWNTRMKRRQRASLPNEVKKREIQNHQQSARSNPSPSSLASLLASASQARNLSHTANVSLYDIFDSSTSMTTPRNHFPDNSYISNPNQTLRIFHQNNGGIAPLPLSCKAPFGVAHDNRSQLSALSSILPLQYNSFSFGPDSTPASGVSFEPNGVPSIRSFVPPTTPTSSGNATSDYVYATPSDADEHVNLGFSRGNSGLLGDLLGKSVAPREKTKENSSEVDRSEEIYMWDYKIVDDAVGCPPIDPLFLTNVEENFIEQKRSHESSPAHSSIGTKVATALPKETIPVDDELLILVDNFPLTAPMADWYDGDTTMPKGQTLSSVESEIANENHQALSSSIPMTASQAFPDHAGPSNWKNVPGIYQI